MRAIGTFVLNLFAALWAIFALYQLGLPIWQQAVPVAISSMLVLWAIRQPQASASPETRKRIGRVVMLSSAGEGILIFLTINALRNFHRDDWIIPAVAAIVGVHFFPLAVGIKLPVYWLTGSAMVIVAGVALYLMPMGVERDAVVAGGCALILWLSSVAVTCSEMRRLET